MKLKKIFLTTILTLTVLLPTMTVNALTTPYTTNRLGGQNRFDTAIKISKEFVAKAKKPVDTVILCTAYGYADSVSVTPFAVYVNAPILLTATGTLTPSTQDRISEMSIKHVYVIGGTGVISNNIMTQLTNMGVSAERIGGTNRFATNQAILAKIPQASWGKSPKFVDAYDPYTGLAVAVDTVDKDNVQLVNPIIFCSDTTDGYHFDSTNNKALITRLSATYGEKFIPYASENTYGYTSNPYGGIFGSERRIGAGPTPIRDSNDVVIESIGLGGGRYEEGISSTESDGTANVVHTLAINKLFVNQFISHPYTTNSLMLTTSSNYIDAISAGPLSAITYCPIVFYNKGKDYSSYKKDYVDAQNVYYVGGVGVVPVGSESIIK